MKNYHTCLKQEITITSEPLESTQENIVSVYKA